jgi:NACHT domain
LERPTHNEVSGTVHGSVVQARTVTVIGAPALTEALAETADQLAQAVGTRWRREEEQRGVQDPVPLPVRWRAAAEELTDHWANIRRAPAGGPSGPLDLTGRLAEIVDVYRRIPSGRLVVLGRAGSGKTILTLRFVLDWLSTPARADAVAVIFSLGSWNPTTTSLHDWLVAQLVRDHPGLAAAGPGESTLAAALVETGRVLPVLDGFDEIADGLHRAALEALNATTMPLLLTSRPAEYAAAVAATDVLTSAAGIELTDLTVTDLADYLPRTIRKTAAATTAWDPVLDELRSHPRSPAGDNLAAVLATPLMVALVRATYSDTPDREPSALLDTNRFSTPEAVEDHLLDSFIPTVYRFAGGHRHWDAERAQHWLGHLARHLDRLGTRDLAWWQLGAAVRRISRTLLVGVVSALAVGLVTGVVDSLMFGLTTGLADGLRTGLTAGLCLALTYGFMDASFEPSRVRMRLPRRTRRVRKGLLPRLVVGLVVGFVFWLIFGLTYGFVFGLVSGVMFGLAAWVMLELAGWFEAPLDVRLTVGPVELLDNSRRSVLGQFLLFGLAFGPIVVFGLWLTVQLLLGPGGPFALELWRGLRYGLLAGVGGGLAYVSGLTAWGQWLVFSRFWLPLTGRLPWALTAFLDDAYRRGVLRQAGAVYQFRHARLQDRLST